MTAIRLLLAEVEGTLLTSSGARGRSQLAVSCSQRRSMLAAPMRRASPTASASRLSSASALIASTPPPSKNGNEARLLPKIALRR